MIKVIVEKNRISIIGHANFAEYGRDIVCAAVSGVVITSIEAIAGFDEKAIEVNRDEDILEIIINKHDNVTNNLIDNMLTCLKEIENKYSKNIKISYKEE